jgi:hypothetical protein
VFGTRRSDFGEEAAVFQDEDDMFHSQCMWSLVCVHRIFCTLFVKNPLFMCCPVALPDLTECSRTSVLRFKEK